MRVNALQSVVLIEHPVTRTLPCGYHYELLSPARCLSRDLFGRKEVEVLPPQRHKHVAAAGSESGIERVKDATKASL